MLLTWKLAPINELPQRYVIYPYLSKQRMLKHFNNSVKDLLTEVVVITC